MEHPTNTLIGKQFGQILCRYRTDMNMTLPDVVAQVSPLAEELGDQSISDAVKLYLEEERYDRTHLGMRRDMDAVEEYFLKTVPDPAITPGPEPAEASKMDSGWNYSLVNDAIANRRLYPAVLIAGKLIGARERELPVLEKAGYRLEGNAYIPPSN